MLVLRQLWQQCHGDVGEGGGVVERQGAFSGGGCRTKTVGEEEDKA